MMLALYDAEHGRFRLDFDTSIDGLVHRDDAEERVFRAYQKHFGRGDSLLLALRFSDVFESAHLEQVRAAVSALSQHEGIDRVESLRDALRVDSSQGFLDIRGVLDDIPEDRDALATLAEEIVGEPLYGGTLVSRDRTTTLVAIYPGETWPGDSAAIAKLRSAAERAAPDAEVLQSGALFGEIETGRILFDDLLRVLPLALAALAAVAALALRSVRGVLLPLAANSLALLWTLWTLAASGRSLNVVTSIVPPVVFVVGFAYAIHVISELDAIARELSKNEERPSRREVAERAVATITGPLLLTAFTTAAGFLSLLLSSIPSIREFGLFCALGVVYAVVSALVVIPALFVALPGKGGALVASGRATRLADRLAALSVARRREVVLIVAAAAALAAIGISRIEANTDFVANFGEDHPVRRDFKTLNEAFRGVVPIEVVLTSGVRDTFKDPETLRRVDALQAWLVDQPEIGRATSLVDYVSFLHQKLGGPEAKGIPTGSAGIEQLLLAAPSEGASPFVDRRFRRAVIHAHATSSASGDLLPLVGRIETRLAALPDDLQGAVTGNAVRVARTVDELSRGQITSLLLATLVIYLTLSFLFQSARVGFWALLPNILPVAFYFGILGLAGIPLSATTALVASAVLGIAVDDSIHFLTRFNAAARQVANEEAGVAAALHAVLRPVTVTTAALCAGFLVLAGSELRNQVEFGVLAAVTLALAWLIDLTFTPALCGRMRFVTIWDYLSVDLGDEPQYTIPLFLGMSKREAQIAALLGDIREVGEGERLLKRGDPGGSLFVILDGEVEISIPGQVSDLALGCLGRGALLGDSSIFGGSRVANADAVTPVRVLRWSTQCFDRIQTRHPKVAAKLLRNLGQTLALRFAEVTERYRKDREAGLA